MMMMSLTKPTQAANALRHVSLSNRNAFSLFLKVLGDVISLNLIVNYLYYTVAIV